MNDSGFSVEKALTTTEGYVLARSGILLPYRLTKLAQLIKLSKNRMQRPLDALCIW